MSFEKQIATLELRLRMAVEHVAQCEQDWNTIRAKAGLPPAKSLFNLDKQSDKLPAGAEPGGWLDDPGRVAWLAAKARKAPSVEPTPQLSEAAVARIIALCRETRPPADSPYRAEWDGMQLPPARGGLPNAGRRYRLSKPGIGLEGPQKQARPRSILWRPRRRS
jgi:hypothetical protein